MPHKQPLHGGQSCDPHLVISHFMTIYCSIQGLYNFFFSFLSISERTLNAEYPGFTEDHSVIDRFQLRFAVLMKSHAKSGVAIWQESQFLDER